jgi:hypothetical protein
MLQGMARLSHGTFRSTALLEHLGLKHETIENAVVSVYDTLQAIDSALIDRGTDRLADIVELANLSSMLGNMLRSGIAKSSSGMYLSNGPHKHPDLLHRDESEHNIEIKVALEDNQPKGHLAKPGIHLTCHYVLCDGDGRFTPGKDRRGNVVRIWMLRLGRLDEIDFNISNTDGDSGKTAVVNAKGMSKLDPVFFDPEYCPLPMTSRAKKSKSIFEAMGLPYRPKE